MTTSAPPTGSLLIIDDEAVAMRNLVHVFKKEGYEVTGRQDGVAGLDALERQRFDVVLTDLRMEKVDGMAILRRARALHPDSEVILITGHATLESAVAAMKEGAFHYVAKPFRLDEVRQVVKSALEVVHLRRENRELRHHIEGMEGRVTIVTEDLAMQRIMETARQIAPTDCNVVVTGESGTGKELFARYIHHHSQRAAGPFLGINCGALHEELLASELFGHEKGSFTGAMQQKHGLIEEARGGTLFLDEVGEMPLGMQVKLLRVIQEREMLRVGGTKPIKVDVRIVAATNRDLKEAVEVGLLRSDLYFRLNVVNLQLPPLRERRDDIPLLAYYFLKKHALVMDKPVADIEPEAMQVLSQYDFPGNVRELSNFIERGVALATGPTVGVNELPEGLRDIEISVIRPSGNNLPTLEAQEEAYIQQVLEHTRGNRTQAAQILGIDRVSLWRKLKRYNMEE